MKKILISAMALAMPMFASAEDIITIAPIQTVANSGWDGTSVSWDNMASVLLKHDVKKPICSVQFDIYLPKNINAELAQGEILPQYKVGKNWNFYHTFDVTPHPELAPAGYDCNRVLIYDSKNTEFLSAEDAESEELMSIGFATDADAATAFSHIYIKDVVVSYFDESNVQQKEVWPNSYSYVKMGDATTGNLVFEGAVSSVVNEALATETAISNLDLSAVTAINGDFTYVAGRDVVAPADVTTSVKYVGKGANYYSVNIPFGGAVTGTGKVYELGEVGSEYAHFDEVTEVAANKTYLAKGDVTIAANAKVAGVAKQTNAEGSYVLDGKFYHGTGLTVPATRGLFDVPAGSNLRVVVDGVLTNITTAQIEAGENAYDLQGRQVQNAKNGVFVVNGKKQFVK